MKTHKIFNYYRYGSATRPSVTNTFISMKMIVSICCTSLLILLLMSSKTSVGQEQPGLLQDPNTPIIETKSKASQNTMEKIVVSDILRSATRNQYNTTSEQYATVLAPRTDGSIYSGVITFTASEPVRIEIQHPISLDNKTVKDQKLQGIIKYSNNQPIPASLIAPNYSDDRFSSSIFFTGKALEFAYEKPFAVMYTVSAVADKSNNTEGQTNTTQVEALEPAIGYQVNSGTLLTAVIPGLSDEILQELPFSDLDPADLSLIIRKVPPDKAGIIISKLPTDQREEILSKIPADKRQEIVKNLTKQ
jgi:MgtE intracellular N domain